MVLVLRRTGGGPVVVVVVSDPLAGRDADVDILYDAAMVDMIGLSASSTFERQNC
jgi:hypothetical protein